jgi:hypothetical protein
MFWKELVCLLALHYLTIVLVALFKYGKLRSLVSMVISLTIDTVVKQWFQLQDPLLHKYGLNCHKRRVWLPWLPVSILHSPTLTGANFVSTSEV